MEKKEIFDLIKKFERSELTALEYETDGERLRLEKTEKKDEKDENIEELLRQLLPLVTAGARAGSGAGVSMYCADAAENASGFGVSPSFGGLQTAASAPSQDASLNSSSALNPGVSPDSGLPRGTGSSGISSGISSETVKAPLVGIFYRAAAPGAKPFVEIGDTVRKGEVMCIIEAMKVMNEIKAPCDLTVTKVLGVDGELVDCGRTLFEVEKC